MVATPAAKKVKAPVRELKNKCWNIENYGAEELVFTDAEVMSTHRFQIINCQGTTIRITCKCMVVLLEGCKKVNLYTDRIMNQVDIVNSQAIQVFAGVQFPMVTCESAKEIKVNLNNATRGCKVQTCCSRSVFVRFPKLGTPDDEQNDPKNIMSIPIGEMFETLLSKEGDEIKTEVVEACE